MQYERWIKSWKSALAENFFLRGVVLLLCLALLLNATFFKRKERIIVVPPQVTKEFWIEKDKASPEYVEGMAVFFAELGGNLSPGNAEFNVHTISDFLTQKTYNEVKSELASQALYIKKNNINQVFYPNQILAEGNTASVGGKMVRYIGTTKISEEIVHFRMLFEMDNYRMRLKEFFADFPDRAKGKKPEEENKKGEQSGRQS